MASSKALPVTALVLRFLVVPLLAASIFILGTDNVKFDDGSKASFKDIRAYRYVIVASIVGFFYALLQIPFAIYFVCTDKRMIRGEFLPEFDFYGDKIIAFLLATAAGAGFGVSIELKKLLGDFVDAFAQGGDSVVASDTESKLDKFFDKANIAIGLLFLGFLCMAVLSVISSLIRSTSSSSSRGFFSR